MHERIKTMKNYYFTLFTLILIYCYCGNNPRTSGDINGIWLGHGIHPIYNYESENQIDFNQNETLWVNNGIYCLVMNNNWLDVVEKGSIQTNSDSIYFNGIHYYYTDKRTSVESTYVNYSIKY